MYQAEFKRCLEECDVEGARAIWARVSPHLPQPENNLVTLVTLHYARTEAKSIRFNLRAYSHAWLIERGLPSGLPDNLRPRAQRLYPRIVEGVGVAVRTPPWRRELGLAVQGAMNDVVLEAYDDGSIVEIELVRARMLEARSKVLRGS